MLQQVEAMFADMAPMLKCLKKKKYYCKKQKIML